MVRHEILNLRQYNNSDDICFANALPDTGLFMKQSQNDVCV